MAGYVNTHLVVSRDAESWEIMPTVCPVADAARKEATETDGSLQPRCQVSDPRYGRRSCLFWYATVKRDNSNERADGSVLMQHCREHGKYQLRCGVLCLGTRKNRPPGT